MSKEERFTEVKIENTALMENMLNSIIALSGGERAEGATLLSKVMYLKDGLNDVSINVNYPGFEGIAAWISLGLLSTEAKGGYPSRKKEIFRDIFKIEGEISMGVMQTTSQYLVDSARLNLDNDSRQNQMDKSRELFQFLFQDEIDQGRLEDVVTIIDIIE